MVRQVMGKNIRRAMALLMSLAMVVCLAPGVFAAGSGLSFNDFYDGSNDGDKCSLTVSVEASKFPAKGSLPVKVYKVADAQVVQGHVVYTHTDLFDYDTTNSDYLSDKSADDGNYYNKWVGNVELGSAYSDVWAKRATALAGYTMKDGFYDVAVGAGVGWSDTIDLASDSKSVAFGDLTRGLYLVVTGTIYSGSTEYSTSPVLICLPNKGANDGADVAWRPNEELVLSKVSTHHDGGGGSDSKESVTVIKKWSDDGNEADRPASITVELLRDGKVYKTQELNDENNWRHTWPDLARGNVWTVNEVAAVSDKYTVSVDKSGSSYSTSYVITNTHTTDIPEEDLPLDPTPPGGDTPGSDTPPTDIPDSDVPLNPSDTPDGTPGGDAAAKLPQTGQLWWPVPILAVAGILMFTIGWTRSRREDADSEA